MAAMEAATAESPSVVGVSRGDEAYKRPPAAELLKLGCEVGIHVVVGPARCGPASLRMRVDEADTEVGLIKRAQGAVDIPRRKLDERALRIKVTQVRGQKINEADHQPPRRLPVAKPKEGSPLLMRVATVKQPLQRSVLLRGAADDALAIVRCVFSRQDQLAF